MEETFQSPQQPDSNGPAPGTSVQTVVLVGLLGLLVLAGLMLPPIALGRRMFGFGYKGITPGNPTLTLDGLVVSLAEPDGSLRVKLNLLTIEEFDNRRAGPRWGEALDALPPALQLVSPVYQMDGRGQPSSDVLLDVAIPEGVSSPATLDLYTWDAGQGQWVFVPSGWDAASNSLHARLGYLPESIAIFRAQRIAPLLSVIQEPGQTIEPELAAAVNVLMPGGLQPAADGSLTGTLAAGALGEFAVVPLVRNYSDPSSVDTASVSAILADVNLQQAHLDALMNLVVAGGNDGIALDYRGLTTEQEEAFTAFVATLAGLLHDEGRLLVVVVPPPTPGPDAATWNTPGYNWQALGAVVDMLEVRPGVSPGDYASAGRGGQVLTWATGQVSRYKLHLGFSALSTDVVGGVGVPISYEDALARLRPGIDPPLPAEGEAYPAGTSLTFTLDGKGVSNVGSDPTTGIYRYDYEDDGLHQVWIMTAAELREQLALASGYNLAGVVAHDLLAEGKAGGVTQAVISYKVSAPDVAQGSLEAEWVMKDAAGKVMRYETVPFGEPFVWEPELEGKIKATVRLRDPEKLNSSSLEFYVGAVTSEEEKKKKKEEEPKAEAASAPAPPAAPPPVASTAEGGFELGGQTHTLEHPDLMHQAGMTWVKFQQKWSPGASGYEVAGNIELGHANGFKVLVSVSGPDHPSSIDYDAYVQYVREVAEAGADGIEIWNEQNFDREWPRDQIGGANYVNNMLAPASIAIKSVDPSILVISGAPTPSGAFPACPGPGPVADEWGCNDYIYIADMAAAGADQYMDCAGVHFNAGATPPSATSGHPADAGDGHYSWYYTKMVNLYSSTFSKPLCFTELGYAVGPDVPSNFSWASGTTVDEQAQWLAETVSLAKGYARLLIVWNVDIYSSSPLDPQGNYAIVRPDGSCPACSALAAVAP